MRHIPVVGQLSCPRDQADLRPFRVGDVEVDTCHTCTGTWLDAGELGRVALDEELEAIANAAREPTMSPFACPRCAGTCHPTRVEGVELDACERCGGIWVDANELREARIRVLVSRAPGGRRGLISVLQATASAPRA